MVMDLLQKLQTLNGMGLFINLIGTILIAGSIGKREKNQIESTDGVPFAYVNHLCWFKTGLGLIIIGTIFQIMA